MAEYILALDQGTTSSRAVIFNHDGQVISMAQKEFTQLFPEPGWVEHDPNEIWSSQASVAAEALVKVGLNGASLKAIGITNQRETTIVWDRKTGDAVYNAIVWQDRRTAAYCEKLKSQGKEDLVRRKTGLVLDAYFSASKINWILKNVPGLRARAEAGELAFGTVDSWLVWKFTRGKVHVTDVTNASRTLLFNVTSLEWDQELLDLFEIPRSMLATVKNSSEVYGETASTLFASKVPIAGIAGDQQAALFGQMCVQPGMVKNTYGTGCFMLMNIGENFLLSQHKLITTIAWQLAGKTYYAFEGSIFIAGAVVQWMRDGLGLVKTAAEIEGLAMESADSGGLTFVPAFAGLGAPYWEPDARGTIFGLTRGTKASHVARAALEAIAFQTRDVLEAMEADCKTAVLELRVDGGATANDLLMQFQADLLSCRVLRPANTETTALGAAYFAGLAVGYWKDVDEIASLWKSGKTFMPVPKNQKIELLLASWKRGVAAARAWATSPAEVKNQS